MSWYDSEEARRLSDEIFDTMRGQGPAPQRARVAVGPFDHADLRRIDAAAGAAGRVRGAWMREAILAAVETSERERGRVAR